MTVAVRLKKADTVQLGRVSAGVPVNIMQKLNVEAGDIIAISAQRRTYARVIPRQKGTDCIETSAQLAENAGADGDVDTTVERASLPDLETVIVKLINGSGCAPADLSEALFDLPLCEGDKLTVQLSLGRVATVEVITADPATAGLFRATTILSLSEHPHTTPGYDQVGGLNAQIKRIHEMVAIPLTRPELFDHLGVNAPRGVLFTGPPGSGKTLLARSIAAKTSAAFYQISGPEIMSKHYGESEAALRKVFQAAQKDAPSIIFIDEIDAIAPKRDGLSGEKQVERRVVAQLLTSMDGLAGRGRVVVMAATNLPDSLDPALRRPGRFDREIDFPPPDIDQRHEILQIHLRDAPLADDVDLSQIARDSHGYVGADLAAVAREASLAALDRNVSRAGGEDKVTVNNLHITQSDLIGGLAATSPNVLRDTIVQSPTVSFADIGGMDAVKSALTEAVIWPQQHQTLCAKLKIRPMSGVLVTGAPGSGKTLIARALATESGINFIPVTPGRIMSQFLGDAERAVSQIFVKARQSAPCIIFFDEIDTLAPRRSGKDATLDRVVAQLLTELDGLASNAQISVIAATNRAAMVDPALLRPGRFDLVIPIPLPDQVERRAILQVHCADLPLANNVDLNQIAQNTAGASGATLAALVSGAARAALRQALDQHVEAPLISQNDFKTSWTALQVSELARQENHIPHEEN